MKLLFLLLLPIFSFAQITNIRVEPSHTQALIYYTAPNSVACTHKVWDMNLPIFISAANGDGSTVTVDTRGLAHALKVGDSIWIAETGVWDDEYIVATVPTQTRFTFASSTSGSAASGKVGLLVNDLNTALFPGSNLDSRNGSIVSGRNRSFVVGTRAAQISGGVSYSRALQVDSDHVYVINCDGSVVSGTFRTSNIPLGLLAVDVPKPAAPGLSAQPSMDKSARWDKSEGVYLDRIIDPLTGVLYTQMYAPEIPTDTAYNVSTTNTPTPTGANWTNPGNVRTNDSTSATYAAATQDILCVRPYLVTTLNTTTKAHWLEPIVSLESVVTTVRGSGAGSGADGDIEVAYNINGDCTTPATEWKTIDLTGSLSSVSFPSGTPQGGFGDWHSATQRRLNHIDVVTRRVLVNTSGTSVTAVPSTTWGSLFDPQIFGAGSKIRIGGTTNDACNAGTEYDIASVESPKRLTLGSSAGTLTNAWACLSSFAVLVRKKTTSTDQINIDYVNFTLRTAHIPNGTDSGSAKIFAEKPVADSDGNEGYVGYVLGEGGAAYTLHWVGKDNGESRFIMAINVNLPGAAGVDGWGSGSCLATENPFSSTDPTSFYCLMNRTGSGQVVVKYKIWWDGASRWRSQTPSVTPFPACTTTSPASPNPCLEATNLTTGYALSDLIEDRNPLFDTAKFAGCEIRGIQTHLMVLNCKRSVQDSIAWIAVFDLDVPIASYDPMDQSTNPVAGAINTLHPSMRGWTVLHSGLVMVGSDSLIQWSPKFPRASINNNPDPNGMGPHRMAIVGNAALNNTSDMYACPTNDWGYTNCSDIHVTSQPFDPDPGVGETGAAGEFGNVEVGFGVTMFKCDPAHPNYTHETIQEGGNKGCDSYANPEYGRILAISGTAPDITLTVARGVFRNNGLPPKNHPSGYSLYVFPLTDYNEVAANINAVWDFRAAPTGTPASAVAYVSQATSHMSLTHKAAVGQSATTGYAQVAWPHPTMASLALPPPVNLALPSITWPAFAGKIGIRYANTIQQYTANNQVDYPDARDTAYEFFFDSRPFMSTPGATYRATWEKVGGATYIYKYKQQQDILTEQPWFKHIPYMITVGNRILTEKSGPSITLADNSGDYWKFCTAYRAGECWPGSLVGESYVNSPYLDLTNLADYTCYGNAVWDEADICAAPLEPMSGPNIQFYFGNSGTMGRGRHLRKIGWSLYEPKMISKVPKVYPTGKWMGPLWTYFLNLHRSGGLMAKLPPIPTEDGYDRTTFLPVSLAVGSAPSGTAVAQVEFGYHDFGTPGQLYCTVRQESCLATGTKVIGDKLVTSRYPTSGAPAAWAYQNVTITSATPMRLTFPSAHKFTSDVRVKATIATSALNNKLWPISIVNSTTVDLVGSVPGDIGTGSQWVMAPATEAPFAFSGESFAVAGATNANPIEISTTTMHRFQTGSNVCLSGVGGNTAANGCFTITATGPSSFTLDGTTGNGSYTSGGTVTPGGVSCASGCTVVVPAFSKRVMYYRWRYLNSSGVVIATGGTQSMVTP